MNRWRYVLTGVIMLLSICLVIPDKSAMAEDKIRIVTTTSVLADVAKQIAGDRASIFYVASPKRDMHHVAPTPKDVLMARKADVFIHHGLQAEPWLLPLLNAAGKQAFFSDPLSGIDASMGIEPLEVPIEVSRLEGDIHPMGNPHYWLDPETMKQVAATIESVLGQKYPELATVFKNGRQAYEKKLDERLADWSRRLKPFEGQSLVTYHRSWSYFAERFGFQVVGEIEPKPGIPVTSRHMSQLIETMKQKKAKIVIKEPFHENKTPRKIAEATGAVVIELAQAVGAIKETDDYLSLMEYNIRELEQAFQEISHA